MTDSPRFGGDSSDAAVDKDGLDADALGASTGTIGVSEAGSEIGSIEGSIIDGAWTAIDGEPIGGSSGRLPNFFIA